jgi:nucleotide-binding universal stress UspA family protein
VILHCLEVNPRERYATAAQLALDMEHPEQVPLTTRAERLKRESGLGLIRRWLKARRTEAVPAATVSGRLAEAPIIMAAVDLSPDGDELADPLRALLRRIIALEPQARIACVNVLKLSRLAVDVLEDAEGRSLHVQRLVQLRQWGEPLGLPQHRITFSVLEATDPASALVESARHNQVDHIVIGARAASALRRYLGSVSSQVGAEAPCSVTVVRTPRDAQPGQPGAAPLESRGPGAQALDVAASPAAP